MNVARSRCPRADPEGGNCRHDGPPSSHERHAAAMSLLHERYMLGLDQGHRTMAPTIGMIVGAHSGRGYLAGCEKRWESIAQALRANVDIALTLYRNGSWAA